MFQRLHIKIMGIIGSIILVTICTATSFYVLDLKKNHLETIEWRSVTLAQSIRVYLISRYELSKGFADIDLILESAYLECKKLFHANRHLNVSFVCVLSKTGEVIIHNDRALWKTRLKQPELLQALGSGKIRTVPGENNYHTLIPVTTDKGVQLGTIDMGFPKYVLAQKIMNALRRAVMLGLALFIAAFILTWLFVRLVVTRPMNRLIDATTQIAGGDLTGDIYHSSTRDFRTLAVSLTRMRDSIRRSMADLEDKNQEIKALIACSPVALFSLDLSSRVSIWTTSAERLFNWQASEVLGKKLPMIPEEEMDRFDELFQTVCKGSVIMGCELLLKNRDGTLFHGSFSSAPVRDGDGHILGVMGTVEDISQRIDREQNHEKVQAQLLQAQKMESVGRLAGGVAHDYNNTLSVILGYAEIILEQLKPEDPKCDDLREIIKATLHSADITRQLLTFARKQTISPKIIDLNEQVENTLKMLNRLIGENIELKWIPGKDLGTVKMDTTQINQILANLCINARDAIETTGRITIETCLATIDDACFANHPWFKPGRYVCLSISDTGSGMDKETLKKIFDPFFTTKAVGVGTGLGLATVYGIVQQNNSFINVYSETGRGSTFNIYFPRHSAPTDKEIQVSSQVLTGQGETLLLVEDDAATLKMFKQMLEAVGYRVIDTQRPEHAVDIVRNTKENIRLLITDVIMPQMNGNELSQKITAVLPDLKTLFMSGYTADVIGDQGVLGHDVNFIQKPFSKKDLAQKIRLVLDG
nr:ATP-binding protein [uncultured Desulfobacter sp.]